MIDRTIGALCLVMFGAELYFFGSDMRHMFHAALWLFLAYTLWRLL